MTESLKLTHSQFAFLMLLENSIAELTLRANQAAGFAKPEECAAFTEAARLLSDKHTALVRGYQTGIQVASPNDMKLLVTQ